MAIIKRNPPLDIEQDHQLQVILTDQPRDEKGRFISKESLDNPEELQLSSDRPIKLVKVPGSYGTYTVKESYFSEGKNVAAAVFVTAILAFLLGEIKL